MVDSSRRGRVGLGLIGLGPHWDQVYRDALVRLQNRMTIRIVYDPVEGRARSVASDVGAPIASSLHQVLQNDSLQGLLVMDPGWCGVGALRMIFGARIPVFLGSPVLKNVTDWRLLFDLNKTPASNGAGLAPYDTLLMPELGLRFTPASCRLRELIVTKLGLPRKIDVEIPPSEVSQHLAAFIDWCSNLFGDDPISLRRDHSNSSAFELEYPAPDGGSATNQKIARFHQSSSDAVPLRITVECEHGHATLHHRTQISWEANTGSANESLANERTETEILIDQFCRRALGGLNPVGQLSELVKATEIVQLIRNPGTESELPIKVLD